MIGLPAACVSGLFEFSAGYDKKPVTVMTQNFFDQRKKSNLSASHWKGDWIFRRKRLRLIDDELRDYRPNILFFQQMVERSGSEAESDKNILSAGALLDYMWDQRVVSKYADTGETSHMGTAVSAPLKVLEVEKSNKMWIFDESNYFVTSLIDLYKQPLLLVNVSVGPAGQAKLEDFANKLHSTIRNIAKKSGVCKRRIVIAGRLPGEFVQNAFLKTVTELAMVDVASGQCQIASRCYTGTPNNQLFLAVYGDQSPSRNERILVHKDTIVYSSERTLVKYDENQDYVKKYGLASIWPTVDFGWVASVRFGLCADEGLR